MQQTHAVFGELVHYLHIIMKAPGILATGYVHIIMKVPGILATGYVHNIMKQLQEHLLLDMYIFLGILAIG